MSSPSALFFGSIGSVAETSDIQRRAYNAALSDAGLDWQWDEPTYRELLEQAGGKDRLSMLSAATNANLSDDQIDAIHAKKTETACADVLAGGTELRPGVRELMQAARDRGMKVGFVTTTYQPNIDAVLDAAGLSRDDFDYVGGREDVASGKPDPECYQRALDQLGLDGADCIAVEDTANSVMAAKRAGLTTIATPGAYTDGQDFWQADMIAGSLADGSGSVRPDILELFDGR